MKSGSNARPVKDRLAQVKVQLFPGTGGTSRTGKHTRDRIVLAVLSLVLIAATGVAVVLASTGTVHAMPVAPLPDPVDIAAAKASSGLGGIAAGAIAISAAIGLALVDRGFSSRR
ncbi:MAG TPA: hypothetical protein ENJ99_00250 [Rhizobiales bacterium]|nr:hypothetical protein [Hyphomicrobiales bacterium]